MEYNKTQNRLQECISFYERSDEDSIKWNEYRHLESVYKNNYLVKYLKARAEYLHKWMHCIGKDVHLSKSGWNYILVDEFSKMDSLNQRGFDSNSSIEFTQGVFDRLCFDYCNYQVERLIEDLLERSITSNSTCKMSNLVFEWNLECTQELIKMFKDLSEL